MAGTRRKKEVNLKMNEVKKHELKIFLLAVVIASVSIVTGISNRDFTVVLAGLGLTGIYLYFGISHVRQLKKDGTEIFEGKCTSSRLNPITQTWTYFFEGDRQLKLNIKFGKHIQKGSTYRIYLRKGTLTENANTVHEYYGIENIAGK